ncbi:MAG: hypothetical protein ACFFFH_21035 [Candidatus Thorarchaeota archaeon]
MFLHGGIPLRQVECFFLRTILPMPYLFLCGTKSIGCVCVFLPAVLLPLGWYYILISKPKVFKPTENGGTCIGKLKASPPVE